MDEKFVATIIDEDGKYRGDRPYIFYSSSGRNYAKKPGFYEKSLHKANI
jgi:hypothetical protein